MSVLPANQHNSRLIGTVAQPCSLAHLQLHVAACTRAGVAGECFNPSGSQRAALLKTLRRHVH